MEIVFEKLEKPENFDKQVSFKEMGLDSLIVIDMIV